MRRCCDERRSMGMMGITSTSTRMSMTTRCATTARAPTMNTRMTTSMGTPTRR